MKYRWLKNFCLIVIISLFLFMPLCLAFEHMLRSYDDVGYAIVAKNLVNGIGYATTINYVGHDFTVSLFDYALGQGPVGILPVALAFKIFVVHPLVPGLVQVAFEFLLLVSIALLLLGEYQFSRTTCFLGISLFLVTLISGWHYEHWYAMLGESIAALFILLGFVVLERDEESPRHGLLAGLFLGFAVLTKEIAAVFVVVFAAYAGIGLLVTFLRQRAAFGRRVRAFLCFCLAGLTPFLAFEGWRLATLGRHGFFANWHAHLAFISSYSPQPQAQAPFANILNRAAVFAEHYYVPALIALCLVIASLVLCGLAARDRRGPVFAFGAGVLAYFAYWIFFSTGPARHLYIGIILFCFFVSLPVLRQRHFGLGLLPACALLLVLVPRAGQTFVGRMAEVGRDLARPRAEAAYATEHRILSYMEKRYPGRKVLTPWWAHVATLEFLSPGWGRFSGWDALKQGGTSVVVVNAKVAALVDGEPQRDAAVLSENGCTPLYASEPYTLYVCEKPLATK